MTHNFDESLKFSFIYDEDINDFYYHYFPTLAKIQIVKNLELQKQGIDKILKLKSGKKIYIDEKKREMDYGDIFLEEYSDFNENTPSWLDWSKKTDYISYIVLPTHKIYLIPFILLLKAWIYNYNSWLKKYGRRFSPNVGYFTSGIPIPPNELFRSINEQMSLEYQPNSNINPKEFFE